MSGEASVTELAEPFEMSLPTISRHLKVLERAGLIVRGRAAQWRPCRLQPAPLKEVAEWVENYHMAWEHKLDRLHDYLSELRANQKIMTQTTSCAAGAGLRRKPLSAQ
jgi:DNA-binding transcriptional ArsR family regulator